MNINKRIEELNTDLVLQETKIDITLKELKQFAMQIDLNSINHFRRLMSDLLRYKNEYTSILTQLKTFTIYQAKN